MKKILFSSSGILLLLFISVNAQASLVFDQQPYSEAGGLVSSIGDPLMDTPNRIYDDFTLSPGANINKISWWGISYYGDPQFTYTFYSDSSGSPGSALVSYDSPGSPTLDTYTTTNGQVIGMYSISLGTPFTATAGTKYWLSIYNTDTGSLWGWQIAPYGNGSYQEPFTIGNSTSNVAFRLEGIETPVPIPAAAWLLGSGLIAFVVIRRRMRTT